MPSARLPANELDRLAALDSYDVLDTICEETFDNLTRLAAKLTGSPTALISLIDADRQWFKSRYGLDAAETHRDDAFCAHAIHTPASAMVVPDATLDPRFADNRLVTGPLGVRFYAGVPLVNQEGFALGALCVLDYSARQISAEALDCLRVLAQTVMATLELRRAMGRMRDMALTDGLTCLPNRVAFMVALGQAIARQRRDGRAFTLLYLDLDGFKHVNDRLGHAIGDAALCETAEVLRTCVRTEDTVARLGGDEFAVLLVGGDGTEAQLVAERIRSHIAGAMETRDWPVTVSVGAVTFIDPPRDGSVALSVADIYLYASKSAGRNRVTFHNHITFQQASPALEVALSCGLPI